MLNSGFMAGGYTNKTFHAKMSADGFLVIDLNHELEKAISEERYEDASELKKMIEQSNKSDNMLGTAKGYHTDNLLIAPIDTFISNDNQTPFSDDELKKLNDLL